MKQLLGKYSEALIDLNKAIELDPGYGFAYFIREIIKSDLKDYQGAFADFDKAIEIDPLNESNYGMRALIKENMGDLQGACSDWRKAADLGDSYAIEWVRNQCWHLRLSDFNPFKAFPRQQWRGFSLLEKSGEHFR